MAIKYFSSFRSIVSSFCLKFANRADQSPRYAGFEQAVCSHSIPTAVVFILSCCSHPVISTARTGGKVINYGRRSK